MACDTGVHCGTGPESWKLLFEPVPYAMSYFTASFATVLYTRRPMAAIAFVLLAQVVLEMFHEFQAIFYVAPGNGPLDPSPAGILKMLFGPHARADSLLITFPFFATIGALLGYLMIVSYGMPVFATPTKMSWKAMYQQTKYIMQLLLIGYLPWIVGFGVVRFYLGDMAKVAILSVWLIIHLLTIWLAYVWNRQTGLEGWSVHDVASGKVTVFYWHWAGLSFVFWLPAILLCHTDVPTQINVLIGAVLNFALLVGGIPKVIALFK